MPRVLLVFPYFYTGIVKDQIFPPLGIGLLSAILKKNGIDVIKLDCTFLSMGEAVEIASACKPDITGFYVMTTLTQNAGALLEQLRQSIPDSIFVAGGPLPTLYASRFAERFDYVFRGEAAASFPDFCRDYLYAPDKDNYHKNILPSAYPGLFRSRMGGIDSPAIHLTREMIDACPVPDREGFDHKRYQQLSFKYSSLKKASIMTTYGCPFACDLLETHIWQ